VYITLFKSLFEHRPVLKSIYKIPVYVDQAANTELFSNGTDIIFASYLIDPQHCSKYLRPYLQHHEDVVHHDLMFGVYKILGLGDATTTQRWHYFIAFFLVAVKKKQRNVITD
jgi:hypothetical protein